MQTQSIFLRLTQVMFTKPNKNPKQNKGKLCFWLVTAFLRVGLHFAFIEQRRRGSPERRYSPRHIRTDWLNTNSTWTTQKKHNNPFDFSLSDPFLIFVRPTNRRWSSSPTSSRCLLYTNTYYCWRTRHWCLHHLRHHHHHHRHQHHFRNAHAAWCFCCC